jgi:GH15 family glucan-1,4-alpha-glucosidase
MVCLEIEGVFLPCSFWLAICLNWLGRKEEAHELFERLLTLQNDLVDIGRIRSAR